MDGMYFGFDEAHRALAERLEILEQEHRNLDNVVAELHNSGADMLRLQRLKREKLRLKDEISRLRSELCPNIIA